MPLTILYGAGFPLNTTSGKNRATRQKLADLQRIAKRVDIEAPARTQGNFLVRAYDLLCCEYRLTVKLITRRNEYDWFISRGLIGFVAVPLARALGIKVAREVHGLAEEELEHVSQRRITQDLLWAQAKITQLLRAMADVRICNHPYIIEYFQLRGILKPSDFYVYNGASIESASSLSKEDARARFGLDKGAVILVFVGSASAWHGLGQLAALQKAFNRFGDNIQIVCGGGKVSEVDDPDRILTNLSPLDEVDCAKLIRAADACLLPVQPNRSSPGSPLKLYDYIINMRPIITQCGVTGYSDEVERFNVGLTTNLRDPDVARQGIVEYVASPEPVELKRFLAAIEQISWRRRMEDWVRNLSKYHSTQEGTS